jgi:hypothetical protein
MPLLNMRHAPSGNDPTDPDRQSSDQSAGESPKSRPSGSAWMSPWPSVAPWFVLVAGVLLGHWIGYSPHLFVAMGAACLVVGLLADH